MQVYNKPCPTNVMFVGFGHEDKTVVVRIFNDPVHVDERKEQSDLSRTTLIT